MAFKDTGTQVTPMTTAEADDGDRQRVEGHLIGGNASPEHQDDAEVRKQDRGTEHDQPDVQAEPTEAIEQRRPCGLTHQSLVSALASLGPASW
jgi:hypothetical protein